MNKKIIIFFVLLALLILILFVVSVSIKNSDKQQNGPQISKDDDYIYENDLMSFEYPRTWKIREVDQSLVYISPETVPSITNLEETYMGFMSSKIRTISPMSKLSFQNSELNQIKNMMTDTKVEELSDISIAELDGFKIIISGNLEGSPIKWMHIYLSNNKDENYNIYYSAKQEKYNMYIGDVNQILNSFKTKNLS